MSYAKVN